MSHFITVVIVSGVYWLVSLILSQIDEDYTIYWACGPLYPIARLITYPIRACRKYELSREYFEKQGVSKVEYVFGKRVKHDV